MNTRISVFNPDEVRVLSDPDAPMIVVQLPEAMWRGLLRGAASFYKVQAASTGDVLSRLRPSPSEAEMSEITESYGVDAAVVLTLLGLC